MLDAKYFIFFDAAVNGIFKIFIFKLLLKYPVTVLKYFKLQ